jgi:hypothetical protein
VSSRVEAFEMSKTTSNNAADGPAAIPAPALEPGLAITIATSTLPRSAINAGERSPPDVPRIKPGPQPIVQSLHPRGTVADGPYCFLLANARPLPMPYHVADRSVSGNRPVGSCLIHELI